MKVEAESGSVQLTMHCKAGGLGVAELVLSNSETQRAKGGDRLYFESLIHGGDDLELALIELGKKLEAVRLSRGATSCAN